jgi:transposase-like protein
VDFDRRTAVLMELQKRGIRDILIACVNGPKVIPAAIETASPKTIAFEGHVPNC